MGTGEETTPTKPSKAASSTQEMPSTPMTPSYPDWSSSMQAFYGGGGAPPFFPSSVTSPTPHPFIWGSQHPMMPPYGTPVPYPTMYHHGVYAHPNMSMAQGPLQGTAESDGKASEGKDRASSKKTKGTSGKAASGSGNDVGTQSGESGSEGSSNPSDDNDNQEFSGAKKGSFDQMLADGANTQHNGANFQTSLVPGNPIPATNLNIGMELWSSGSGAVKLQPNRPGVVASSGIMNDQWIQDERELKKQKRKQSNRESARKSRLRKQAECEELQHRVETLNNENQSLRDELRRLSEECEKLTSENNSIKEELTKLCGPEAVSRLEMNNSVATQQLDARGDEGNC